jgi:hypothetical protein
VTAIKDGRARAQETLERMGPDVYRRAYTAGMSLSAYLEREDPSEGYGDGLDAFERLLRVANIRSVSRPEIGVYADTGEAMLGPNAPEHVRSLFPEWAARMWRAGKSGASASTRDLHTIADYAPGGVVQPWATALDARATRRIAPAIPLSELIAITSPINGAAYEAFYITDAADEQRMVRATEGAEIPRAKLTGGEQVIKLKKYGRVLEATYEFMRRARLDWLGLHIQRMAAQVETDKVSAVIAVLVNGDGNAGTQATVYNLTTLDSAAVAGTVTLKGWLAFKMKFANPYTLTAALTQEAVALQLMLLNAGSANVPAVTFGQTAGFNLFRPINPGLADGTGLGWTTAAPALKVVAMDARLSVEQVTEIGAQLQEVQRWTTRQVETLTLSEVEGYKIFDPAAAAVLDINA